VPTYTEHTDRQTDRAVFSVQLPDVGLCSENSIKKRFGRHPLNWQHRSAAFTIVVRTAHVQYAQQQRIDSLRSSSNTFRHFLYRTVYAIVGNSFVVFSVTNYILIRSSFTHKIFRGLSFLLDTVYVHDIGVRVGCVQRGSATDL